MFGCKLDIMGFGYCDLNISNDCNLNNNSFSILGYSYELPNELSKESEEANTYLAGSHEFKIIELEIYQILNWLLIFLFIIYIL